MDYSKSVSSDETLSTSVSSNDVSSKSEKVNALNSSPYRSLDNSAMLSSRGSYPLPGRGGNRVEPFEVSFGDASNVVQVGTMGMDGTESTTEGLLSSEEQGDVSPPPYLHNLVRDEPFSSGLPPPPILLDTRIGSENSAFSSVSGVRRPIPSKLSPSSSPQDGSLSTSSEQSEDPWNTRSPSPRLSKSDVEGKVHVVSPVDPPLDSPEAPPEDPPEDIRIVHPEEPAPSPVKTGPQRRIQLFERASRLATRARRLRGSFKEASADPQSPSRRKKKGQPPALEIEDHHLKVVSDESPPSSPRHETTEAVSVDPPPTPSPPPSDVLSDLPKETERKPSLPPTHPNGNADVSFEAKANASRPSVSFQNRLAAAPDAIKALYARASPLARMRSDRAQEAAAMSPEAIAEAEAAAAKAAKLLEKQQKTEEEIVKETHRRWRRSLQHAKRKQKMHLEGDTFIKESTPQVANLSCETDQKLFSLLKHEIQNLISNGCGSMNDIISVGGSFDEESIISEDSFTSENESDFEEEERRRGRSRKRESRRHRREPSRSPRREESGSQSESSEENHARNMQRWEQPFDEVSESAMAVHTTIPPAERPSSRASTGRHGDVGINDKNFIKKFIEEASQEGMSFIWHKEARSSESLCPSESVQLLLKLGYVGANGKLVGPRLAWDEKNNNDVDNCSVDLFDIQSVEKSTAVQMQNYPFAIPGNSFFVRKNDGTDFVFEASNDEEARRFIHGLRWLVARLAFNLIIGNRDVSCELVSLFKESNSGDDHGTSSGFSAETQESKAMNDVTNHLVEKIIFHSMEM